MGQCHISKRSKQKSKSRARSHKKVPYLNDQEWLKIFSYLEDKEDMKSALMKCWRWFTLEFPMGRDSATFRDKGTEISSLSLDNGTSSKFCHGTGRDFDSLSRPGTSRGTETKKKIWKIKKTLTANFGCPGPSRPLVRFLACPVVPLSRDKEETSVPLSRKVALSRPVHMYNRNLPSLDGLCSRSRPIKKSP